MHSITLALAALVATVAANLGSGTIINNCDYEVDMNNVPSADGVHELYSTTLAANGGTYSQTYTSLANNNGWSMKLNPSSDPDGPIMQFEYTYSDDAPDDLWFDLSYVNGMPFEKDWVISSNSLLCIVKQTAYNDPTDDANGMQPLCSPDTDITVTLCSTSAGILAPLVSSVVDKVAAVVAPTTSSTEEAASSTTEEATSSTTEEATSSTTEAAAPTTTSTEAAPTTSAIETSSSTAAGSQAFSYIDTVASSTESTPSATTLATVTTALATKANGYVVTEIDTVVATDVVTVYGHTHHDKRHDHAHRHAHRHARR